jgi:hypothetical protein
MPFVMPQIIPAQDLLGEWLKRIRVQNSDFSLRRTIAVPDQSLVDLRNFFVDFFGEDFFLMDATELKSVTLKSKNSDWFLQLLVNDDYPSLLQVYETAHLLKKVAASHPDLYKVLKSNIRNQGFRNYLFEAVIYELLSINNVRYEAKPVINGREKEGYLWLNGQQFLFECKKLYSYQLPGIGFIFSIHDDFFRLWQKKPVSINGYITVMPGTEPSLRKNRYLFTEAFNEYFQQVRLTGNLQYEKDLKNSTQQIIGKVLLEKYNAGLFEHQLQLIHQLAVCFKVLPTRLTSIEDELKEMHNMKLQFKFHMMEQASMDYLLAKLSKKRTRQSDMKHLPRIFFFDNEIYRGSEFSLFQSEGSFDEQRIQDYVDSKGTDDIVCLVFRKYSQQKIPGWQFKVYCKSHLNSYKRIIESWKSLYSDPGFSTNLPAFVH